LPKTPNQKTGTWGEDISEKYLIAAGYKILERNWRKGRAEIDMIAFDKETLVFIEVKTRKNSLFGNPEEFVNASKANRIKSASVDFQIEKKFEGFIRFDIVSITGTPSHFELLHLKDSY